MPSTLESRYRLLLSAYPADYRRDRGEEIIGTLLDDSAPDQRWPAPADAVDLVTAGTTQRLGPAGVAALRCGVAYAAPIALAVLAGLSGWLLAHRTAFAPVTHAGPALAQIPLIAWLAATAGHFLLPARTNRWLLGAALTSTVALGPLLGLLGVASPGWHTLLGTLVPLGAVATAGLWRSRPTGNDRLAIAAMALAALFVAQVGTDPYRLLHPERLLTFWYAERHTPALVLGVAFGTVLLAGLGRALLSPGDTRLLWATAILLAPTGTVLAASSDPSLAFVSIGGLPQLLMLAATAWTTLLAGLLWSAGNSSTRHNAQGDAARGPVLPRLAGTAAVGYAVALGLFVTIAGQTSVGDGWWPREQLGPFRTATPILVACWLAVAACWGFAARRWIRVAVASTTAATAALYLVDLTGTHWAPPKAIGATLTALAVVAFVAAPHRPARRAAAHVAGTVAATLGGLLTLGWTVAAEHGSAAGHPELAAYTMSLAVFGAAVPLALAAATAWPAVRDTARARQLAGGAALVAAGSWLVVMLVPYTTYPQLALAVGAALLVTVTVAALPKPTGSAPRPVGVGG